MYAYLYVYLCTTCMHMKSMRSTRAMRSKTDKRNIIGYKRSYHDLSIASKTYQRFEINERRRRETANGSILDRNESFSFFLFFCLLLLWTSSVRDISRTITLTSRLKGVEGKEKETKVKGKVCWSSGTESAVPLLYV